MPGRLAPSPYAPPAGDPLAGEAAWASYGALVTAAYVGASMLGVGGRPLTMAVAAGSAALAAATSSRLTVAGLIALGAIPLATAACLGGGRGRELAATIAVLAAVSWPAARARATVAGVGAVALVLGVYGGEGNGALVAFAIDPGDSVGAAVLLSVAALCFLTSAVASKRVDPLTVLLVPAMLTGLAVAGGGAVDARVAVAVAGVVAAIAVAADRPAGALGALAVAASAGLDETGVVALLAVSATLLAGWAPRPVPVVAIVAVPGLAGLAAAVGADPTPIAAGVGAFAALCALAVVTRTDADQWLGGPIPPAAWPATALAVWAALAPQTWGWLGPLPPPVLTAARGLAAATALVAVGFLVGAVQRARPVKRPRRGRPRRAHR